MEQAFPNSAVLVDTILMAALFASILGCMASRSKFLPNFLGWLRKDPVVRGLLVTLLLAFGPITTRSKNGQLAFPRPPMMPRVQSTAAAPSFVVCEARTNGIAMVAPTTNAIVSQACLLHGASEQGEWIELDLPFFRWGPNDIRRLYASPGCLSFGTKRHPAPDDTLPNGTDAEALVVLRTPIGIVPEANWHLLDGTGVVSRFWHDRLPGGGRVFTWENALLDRLPDRPATIQAELRPNGDFVYRYDFSQAAPTNAFLIGAQRGAAAVEALRAGVETNSTIIFRVGDALNTNGVTIAELVAPSPIVELRWKNTADLGDLSLDPDNDGLSSHDEILLHGTDPHYTDTDADGIADNIELMMGTDALNADEDGDGIPDGTSFDDWMDHPLRAEDAASANLVVSLQSAIPPGASATLVVGDLSLPLRNPVSIPLSLPPGQFVAFRLVSRGGVGVPLSLAPGGVGAAIGLEDPDGVFSGAATAGSGRFAWATLALDAPEGRCLHNGADGLPFTVDLRPWSWASTAPFATLEGFSLEPDNKLWLASPEPPHLANEGSVSVTAPWLLFGSLSATDSIHLCAGDGSLCLACGRVHLNDATHTCSHAIDCAARFSYEADCDCLALFVRVNSDDDDLDGTEDRHGSSLASFEDDLLDYHAVGDGGCCCEQFGDALVRITGVSSGLRLWTGDGVRIPVGGTVSNTAFLVEATGPSPGIGMGSVAYDILDGDGETLRSILRRFTMANVQICADLDGDGTLSATDAGLKSVGLGTSLGNLWLVPRRDAPYRISLRNECATTEGTLQLSMAGGGAFGPALRIGPTTNAPALLPGEATNAEPFCVRNASTTLWLDTSAATNAVVALNYSLDFEGIHAPISDTLYLRVVDLDMHDIAVTTNELASLVYDYSGASTPIEWELLRLDTDEIVATTIGGVFDPPDDLPVGTYVVIAFIDGIHENGHSYAVRSARLDVGSIVFEPQTTALDPTGRHAVNPSCLGKGLTGWFAAEVSENFEELITWTADPAINVEFPDGTNGSVVSVEGRFFGDTDLRMNIEGFIGPLPQTTVRIMPTNSVPVNAWIVHDGSGTYPATPERIAACVEKANDIFFHTGLSFHLESISYTNNEDWLVIPVGDNHNWPKANEICAITNGTGGIECYFVSDIREATGLCTPYGILVEKDAHISTLAHEIGHACGLADIYTAHNGSGFLLDEFATHNSNQEDWGTDVDRGYYQAGILQRELVVRNVMCSDRPLSRRDVARGDILGIWYTIQDNPATGQRVKVWHKSLAPVGFTSHAILPPVHY